MRATKTITLCLLLAITTTIASGQVAYVLRDPGVGQTEGFYLPSAAYPGGSNAANPRVPTPSLPHFFQPWPTGAGYPLWGSGMGGLAIDEATMRTFSSDGRRVWEEAHEPYASTAPLFPATSGPLGAQYTSFFPPQPPGQHAGATPFIMGLTVDSQSGTLWMCNQFGFQAFSSTYPYLATGPYINLITQGTLHHGEGTYGSLTGIAFDSADNTIWVCESGSRVHHVTDDGTVIGNFFNSGIGDQKGITVNSSNTGGLDGTGPRCSSQIDGFRVIVTDGKVLCDVETGATLSLSNNGLAYGLAFCSDGQYSYGETPDNTATLRIERPFIRDVGPILLHLEGASPYQAAVLAWGRCPESPGWSFFGGSLRVLDGFVWPLTTDAFGNATVSIPAHLLPVGFQFTVQWAHESAIWALTDAMTLTLGLQ